MRSRCGDSLREVGGGRKEEEKEGGLQGNALQIYEQTLINGNIRFYGFILDLSFIYIKDVLSVYTH